jgi:hydrogenase small subunit
MPDAGEEPVVHILWMNGGLSCDGDSVALTAATQPSIEEIVLGALPGLPKVAVHWPLIDFECGPEQGTGNFIEWWHKADRGELDPFVLVVEGSIPNEAIKREGYWCGFGNNPATGQPMTTSEWLDRLAPKAAAILAVGTCATYGGIHAMAGNPTGAMGVPDYLGWTWKSKAGLPIVCVPGCPIHLDNLSETILFMPFMDEPPGARVSTSASEMYGTLIRTLRGFTKRTADKEPKWRVKGDELRTGYQKTW